MQLFNRFGYYGSPVLGINGDMHRLDQPELDYGRCIGHLRFLFPEGMTFSSVGQLRASSEAIIAQLRRDEALSGLLNGVHLPVCLPQLTSPYYGTLRNWLWQTSNDYGTLLGQVFLPAFERAYCATFPRRAFTNQVRQYLANQLSIVPESRHQHLFGRMHAGPVPAMYFPSALYGLSPSQSRGIMQRLPPHVLLAGGLDVATALTIYPELLCRDSATLELAMAALNWRRNKDVVLSVKGGESASGVETLYLRGALPVDHGLASSGLLVLDPALVN